MSRAKWKCNSERDYLLKGDLSKIKIWSRSSIISRSFLGRKVLVHKGNSFKSFFISRDHIGYKFGCFASTRKFTIKEKKLKLKGKNK